MVGSSEAIGLDNQETRFHGHFTFFLEAILLKTAEKLKHIHIHIRMHQRKPDLKWT